jgi:2,3-bisphosphoglycerate-dependent phosphoglycerate mutase
MEIYIVRHGQSTNNALEDLTQRVRDPELTDNGRRQADAVANHLARGVNPESSIGSSEEDTHVHFRGGYELTHVYCSAMRRALLTTVPIARETGIVPEIWVDIHERGGIYLDHEDGPRGYPGMSRGRIEQDFPGFSIPPEISAEGWWTDGLEGPSVADGRAIRVAESLREMATAGGDRERIALVTHAGFAATLIKALLGRLPDRSIYFHHYNTAITRIDLMEDGFVWIRYLNRIEHLSPDLIT